MSFWRKWIMRTPKLEPIIYDAHSLSLSPTKIPKEVRRIIKTLQDAGYPAFIVGGAVRDLLRGITPKDFDIVTCAKPHQITALFNKAMVIGRRFQIVHVREGGILCEVSTFRNHEGGLRVGKFRADKSGFILKHNVYSKRIEEDVKGRDFTVNALYLDPTLWQLYDFYDGLDDLKTKRIAIIGEPEKRLVEDPVRIIRAIRFSEQLGFKIEPELSKAITDTRDSLSLVNDHRLMEEFKKLFINPHAESILQSLVRHDLLEELVPPLAEELKKPYTKRLLKTLFENTKTRIQDGKSVQVAFLLATMFWSSFQKQCRSREKATRRKVESIAQHIYKQCAVGFVYHINERIGAIWALQKELEKRDSETPFGKELAAHQNFRAAYDFLCIRVGAGENRLDPTLVEKWRDIYENYTRPAAETARTYGRRRDDRRRRRR